MALIEIRGLSAAFGDAPVLDQLDLSVEAGATLAVLGGNGSGKTTLARHLSGWSGSDAVRIDRRTLAERPIAERASLIQYVGQVPGRHLSGRAFSVRDEIAFGPENLLLPREEIARRVEAALVRTGLVPLAARDPFTLSGGEQQRLVLAAALAMEPEILVLDEPVSNLDPEARGEVLDILAELAGRVTLVWLDTSLALLRRLGGRQMRLEGGRLNEVEPGELAPDAGSIATQEKLVALPTFRAAATEPAAASLGAAAMPAVLSVENLSFGYAGAPPLLADLSFRVGAGEILALIGPNGAGKSTLLRLINGLLKPAGGRISIEGFDTRKLRVDELARHVGTVFQEPEYQIFEPTVRREVEFGPRQLGLARAEIDSRRDRVLARTGLAAEAGRHPLDLTHAQQRFVAIASVLANAPKLLLLDEAQRGLDALHTERLEAILAAEKAAGTATVIISHDLEFVARNATAILDLGIR
ncbi:ABC transporter ATP-binding protein [Kaistia nematophila]|uniref:ATP-binding cassette domain-containing protein n=1 Tax=Kaistia nematophila TaxID=2994654 RepID=A0A9X3IMT7_9HYPH|nr:ABC transporter ATP-binding protein [Kaistia nematophila]MCX5570260.1 ATP-binding cassette domain-containing protein [Kaistia nematophila]